MSTSINSDQVRHVALWDHFCSKMRIADMSIPLFDVDEQLVVSTKTIGASNVRSVLRRSEAMEMKVLAETDLLVKDWEQGLNEYDGLIYLMYVIRDKAIIPYYIGKAETIGKGNGNLSANIKNLHRDKSKFARWGDNYAYHIGDLSSVVLPGHDKRKQTSKYTSWANTLFVASPEQCPQLRENVYFWSKAWRGSDIGIWDEFGPTRLTFLEYLLIGVASSAFPTVLLNREGQNRV